ncbi:hypothetical protein FHT48_002331 [Novosphingobium sp. BK280]|nr:hypothetical protein [Novosphingobium sp. BK256]MBB3374922.1 hypothetical protein [Novosphingobium sp. BK280]MBB3421084.1 hypothetical protein [Novosphingobium sp. BK267]MBB3449343.1 hypothetical protein [Novosphingobium sp. BK352]MBB3501510.1 hypothetical protein [Novosphingobium sp. BK336]MBB3556691.1 hypothetical protein [Novosphingobium sp. BK349]MBB3598311.1 hypothetical protein [Novosphingobium sp. BK540]MBB3652800.1 hypothetical protein [Novosphingobium sp. BK626]
MIVSAGLERIFAGSARHFGAPKGQKHETGLSLAGVSP